MTHPASGQRRRRAAILTTTLVLLAACGNNSGATLVEPTGADAESASAVVEGDVLTDGTAAPASAVPQIESSDSLPSTTTPAITAPPTTTVPLPTPALIPLDDESSEPVVPLGSIVIPAIGIDRPLFEGIRLPTFDLGPGHWPGTPMPGELGNVVVGGHRTESNADFGDLDRLQPGDEVVFNDATGAGVTYLVESTEIVDPFAAVIVNQTRAHTATLFACHPKGSTDQRIVVRLVLNV